jgi:predicted negative regulator of RcsB-dependent stress response
VVKIKEKKEKEKAPQPQVELVTATERLFMSLKPHLGKITVLVVGAGIALGAYTIYGYFQDKARAERTYALTKAMDILTRPVDEVPDPSRAPDPEAPKFKTLTERSTAALEALQKVIAEKGTAPPATQALLASAASAYDLGKLDDAIQSYQKYLGIVTEPSFRAIAQEGLGEAFEAKALGQTDAGQRNAGLDQALYAYTEIDKAGTGPFAGLSLYHQGRITSLKGDPAKAAELYKKALEKPLLSSLKLDIQTRLALVEKKE